MSLLLLFSRTNIWENIAQSRWHDIDVAQVGSYWVFNQLGERLPCLSMEMRFLCYLVVDAPTHLSILSTLGLLCWSILPWICNIWRSMWPFMFHSHLMINAILIKFFFLLFLLCLFNIMHHIIFAILCIMIVFSVCLLRSNVCLCCVPLWG